MEFSIRFLQCDISNTSRYSGKIKSSTESSVKLALLAALHGLVDFDLSPKVLCLSD